LLCKHNVSFQIQDVIVSPLYNRIAVFRAERGVSRRELAETVGVNNQTIGYLERGDYKPSLELAMKIAAYFGVPIEMLFSFCPFESVADALRRAAAAGEPIQ
jgi:putative transcriptional regulator